MNNDRLFYLSIDPGEQTTGWASFDSEGAELEFGKIRGGPDAFMDWLESLVPQPREIIYENYRVSPTINHGFSKVVTAQLIGMIKHVDDQISAFAHGVYYLQKAGIRKSRVAK